MQKSLFYSWEGIKCFLSVSRILLNFKDNVAGYCLYVKT